MIVLEKLGRPPAERPHFVLLVGLIGAYRDFVRIVLAVRRGRTSLLGRLNCMCGLIKQVNLWTLVSHEYHLLS